MQTETQSCSMVVDVLDNDNETLINYTYVYYFLTAPVIGQFSDKAYASTAEVLIAVQTDCTYVYMWGPAAWIVQDTNMIMGGGVSCFINPNKSDGSRVSK
jgi:hypothetical protein